MKTRKTKRTRVSREKVAANARAQNSTTGLDWLILPKGVAHYAPEKAETVWLNFLPYEVQSDNHPDKIARGTLWYKLPIAVHFGMGPDGKAIVCPASLGGKCPICVRRRVLCKDYEENEKECKRLNAQKWTLFNIVDPKDADKVCVFAFSNGKFASMLADELLEDEDNLLFYDVTEDGRTLKIRWKKDSYMGTSFITASRLDFSERDEMDEDEVLGRVVELGLCIEVLSYDQVNVLFKTSVAKGDGDDECADKCDGCDKCDECWDCDGCVECEESEPERKKNRRRSEPDSETKECGGCNDGCVECEGDDWIDGNSDEDNEPDDPPTRMEKQERERESEDDPGPPAKKKSKNKKSKNRDADEFKDF